ncbi:MAG: hypothetical protein ACNA7Y_04385, partial [Gammaproteobacteria bacterium]
MTESLHEIKPLSEEAITIAAQHLGDILSLAIMHSTEKKALVIFDTQCSLAVTLTAAYKRCLPTARFIDFYTTTPEEVISFFKTLEPSDLVILIQSTSFRLNAFRLRVELFHQSLKVIEHPHLSRMPGREGNYYIEALAYDASYFRGIGHALKKKIDSASYGVIDTGGDRLVFD